MEKKEVWICSNCGKKYGNKPVGIATWHEDVCDICGKKTVVTEPRDFGYLNQNKLPVEHISKKMYPTGSMEKKEELLNRFIEYREKDSGYIYGFRQSIDMMLGFLEQELDKAREEGYKKGYIDGQIEKINKPKTVVSEFDKTSYLT